MTIKKDETWALTRITYLVYLLPLWKKFIAREAKRADYTEISLRILYNFMSLISTPQIYFPILQIYF